MLSALRVFFPFALGYLLSYLLRVINAVAGEPISRDLGLTAGDIGLLTSLYFVGFALAQLPFGVLIDRYGPRRVEALVLLAAAAGCLMFSAATGFIHLAIGRTLMGVGASLCLMAPLTAYSRWFSRDRLPMINGVHLAFGAAGGVLGGGPTDALISHYGWQPVFAGLALLMVGVSAAIGLVVPRRNEPMRTEGLAQLSKDLGIILKSRNFWRIAPVSATVQGVLLSIGSLWAGPWLRQVAGFDDGAAADWLSLISVGMLAGFLATGWLAQRAARSGRGELVIGLGAVGFIGVQALIIVLPPAVATPLWVLFTIFGAVGALTYAAAVAYFPAGMAGRLNTMLNFVVFVVAFFLQWLFGVLLDRFPDGAGGYQPLGYDIGFAILVVLQVLSLGPLILRRAEPVKGVAATA